MSVSASVLVSGSRVVRSTTQKTSMSSPSVEHSVRRESGSSAIEAFWNPEPSGSSIASAPRLVRKSELVCTAIRLARSHPLQCQQ